MKAMRLEEITTTTLGGSTGMGQDVGDIPISSVTVLAPRPTPAEGIMLTRRRDILLFLIGSVLVGCGLWLGLDPLRYFSK
jgi:hypothetical protein